MKLVVKYKLPYLEEYRTYAAPASLKLDLRNTAKSKFKDLYFKPVNVEGAVHVGGLLFGMSTQHPQGGFKGLFTMVNLEDEGNEVALIKIELDKFRKELFKEHLEDVENLLKLSITDLEMFGLVEIVEEK